MLTGSSRRQRGNIQDQPKACLNDSKARSDYEAPRPHSSLRDTPTQQLLWQHLPAQIAHHVVAEEAGSLRFVCEVFSPHAKLIPYRVTTRTTKPHPTTLVLCVRWLKLSFWEHSTRAYDNPRICERPRLRNLGHGSCTCTEAERRGCRLQEALWTLQRSTVGFGVACKCRPVLAAGARGRGGTHGRHAQSSLNFESRKTASLRRVFNFSA